LFGCDVILDKNLRPSLLEVNVSPSLMGSSPLDRKVIRNRYIYIKRNEMAVFILLFFSFSSMFIKIKGTLIADLFHLVGIYPYDKLLMKQFDCANTGQPSGQSAPSFSSSSSSSSVTNTNPFTFSSLSKMMTCQDRWRRDPNPMNIDLSALAMTSGKGGTAAEDLHAGPAFGASKDTDSVWMMILMIDDEFSRGESTQFMRLHPLPETAIHYNGLYRMARYHSAYYMYIYIFLYILSY
jgi:hypothetical protein